jgi:hypothetical protein
MTGFLEGMKLPWFLQHSPAKCEQQEPIVPLRTGTLSLSMFVSNIFKTTRQDATHGSPRSGASAWIKAELTNRGNKRKHNVLSASSFNVGLSILQMQRVQGVG